MPGTLSAKQNVCSRQSQGRTPGHGTMPSGRVQLNSGSKVIAWIRRGKSGPTPCGGELEAGENKVFLVLRLAGAVYRRSIKPRLLARLLPDQLGGAMYIYRPTLRLPADDEG